jgi:hypothetical protein
MERFQAYPDDTLKEFKPGPDFISDTILMTAINSKPINRLPTSLTPVDCPRATSASMVAAKLERIRVIVRARRSQRSEVCNEIRVVMDMDLPFKSPRVPARLR